MRAEALGKKLKKITLKVKYKYNGGLKWHIKEYVPYVTQRWSNSLEVYYIASVV